MLRALSIAICLIFSATLVLAAEEVVARKAVARIKPSAASTTQPALAKISGTVTFTESGGKLMFVADVDGLAPNTKHGFHIHEKGDLSAADLSSAGAHFNPDKDKHGGHETPHRHAGDLGNLSADDKGHAHAEGAVPGATLGEGERSVIGKSVIVHAKEDDLKTDPSGNSGGRAAGGVVELQK